MKSQRVKNKKVRHETNFFWWRDSCSLYAVTSSVIYYSTVSTHSQKNVIYLFYTIKIPWFIEGFLVDGNRSIKINLIEMTSLLK